MENKEKKKVLFKNNVISKLIGFIFFFLISVSFIINTGSAIALFIFGLILFGVYMLPFAFFE